MMRRRGAAIGTTAAAAACGGAFLVSLITICYYYYRRRREELKRQGKSEFTDDDKKLLAETSARQHGADHHHHRSGSRRHPTVGVDANFIRQMRKLLPICIPSVASKEALLLGSLAGVLVIRTWLDIWFSAFNGVVVRSIVTRDWTLFWSHAIVKFGLMMWPMSIVNNSLKLNINMLSLAFRSRLTEYAHEQYLSGITFYKTANLDNRIQNADQLLTQDIDKFSETMTRLYSDIAKPLVDICLFAYKLGESIGMDAPMWMLGYFGLSGVFLRLISPPFGKYTAQEQMLEGQLRYNHSRIIAHSEEIAFYRGGKREQSIVNSTFSKIKRHLKRVFLLRFGNGIIDSVLVKYCATQIAYYILSRPSFKNNSSDVRKESTSALTATRIMEDYSRNSGYLINLSQAVGRLVLAGRDLTRFAGYTHRVSEFLAVLDDINQGRYQRTMTSRDPNGISEMKVVDQSKMDGHVVWEDGVIEFVNVPICTPNGDLLVSSISLRLERNMHCLITGPNGCGKSSLFRILGGLWPLFGGTMVKPSPRQLFYVPQKPYLSLGSLRDQLIYPHSELEAKQRGFDDDKLLVLLEKVHLAYLVDRNRKDAVLLESERASSNSHTGWDAVCDWTDVLSGGEKQRIAMARLFYHRPQFAILDECTSAVSLDVEGEMYNYAKSLDITLFTISHRPSLLQYHQFLLKFDGEGSYSFGPLDPSNGHAFDFSNMQQTVGSDDGGGGVAAAVGSFRRISRAASSTVSPTTFRDHGSPQLNLSSPRRSLVQYERHHTSGSSANKARLGGGYFEEDDDDGLGGGGGDSDDSGDSSN